VATLLAIRSLLSNLTTTKINFLMLDEVVNTLDEVGREKLAEILLKENLNTFIVSHGWEHPLIDKLYIRKKHHISRIEK
jgi:DNA repair exonuclease SbcCD ATPase subunit